MKRFMAAALLVSAVSVLGHVPASASVDVVSEPVARKMVTSSPQTTGPGGSLSWGLDRIDQRTAVTSTRSYSFATNGTGVNIYILDSGVAATHPEFGSRVLNGWSYRSSGTALASYNSALAAYQQDPETGIEACANDGTHAVNPLTFDNPAQPDPSDVGRTDNDGHGTHVAGIAAGDSVGVAKNANIIPVRALDSCGNGTRTMILEALAWILADHDAGEKAVLNLSVGFGEQVTSVDNAIIAIMNEGVPVAAAAGNSAVSACNSTPASTPGTISIGSSTILDTESEFSNYGDCVDIFAPGGSSLAGGAKIVSAYPYLSGVTNTYANLTGTSMASPFVVGAMARYLQTVSSTPTSFTTGPTAAWTWLSGNATPNAITYYNSCREKLTPNRILFSPISSGIQNPTPPGVVAGVTAVPSNNGAVVSWSNNDQVSTYKATATISEPCTGTRAAMCSVVGGNTCSLTGLTNGSTYTITVTGTNSDGTSPAASTTVVAGLPPEAPATITAASKNAAVALVWSASIPNATYVVTSSPPSVGCTTTTTSCTVAGLKNGVNYTFAISATSTTGLTSTTQPSVSARPGFVVKRSAVSKGSKTLLTSLLTTASRGKKTWSESGACSISSGRLVAPRRTTSCVVKLTVAKSGSYPKMTTPLKVTVK